jgi:anti-anti-sigma regulatory factor
MAHNFKMNIHRRIDKLTIHLAGDFDGSSAWELINAIRENLKNSKFIQIDTGELKMVYPFGREVFRNFVSNAKNTRIRMQFNGPNAL